MKFKCCICEKLYDCKKGILIYRGSWGMIIICEDCFKERQIGKMKTKKQKEHSKEMYDLGYRDAIKEVLKLIEKKYYKAKTYGDYTKNLEKLKNEIEDM